MSDLDAILAAVKATHELVAQQGQRLQDHITEEESTLKRFIAGFPGEDPVSHCAAHLEWIEEVKERKEFYRKMRFELARWGLLGFLGWAFFQLWSGFLKGPHS
jgi:hypothetical protein